MMQQRDYGTEDGSSAGDSVSGRQYVTFTCGGQAFGIDIMAVREIRNWSPVTPLPAQRPDVLGVIDIRGRVVPIHDLALRIGCSASARDRAGQVVLVLSLDGGDMGLLVDDVSDIIAVDQADLLAVPHIEGSFARFLSALARKGDQLVAILDEQEIRQHSAAEANAPDLLPTPKGADELVYLD